MAASQSALPRVETPGIGPEDDRGPHPASPDHPWWSESVSFDWLDEAGARGGLCRIGLHPNQERMWFELLVCAGGEWIALEQARLPLPAASSAQLAYDGFGLAFCWKPSEPLKFGHLRVSGFGRVHAGPRAGAVLPVELDLDVEARGAPMSRGPSRVGNGARGGFASNRFAQPTYVCGRLGCGEPASAFEGWGGRERCWGPRSWGHEWQTLQLPTPPHRLEISVANVPNAGRFQTGHAHREQAPLSVEQADLRLVFRDTERAHPVGGSLSAQLGDGSKLAGSLEVVSSTELDVTHLLDPPQRSVCGRALVRFVPKRRGWRRPRPSPGWLEWHRFQD